MQGIILVYDITSQKSFDNITKWLQNIEMVRIDISTLPFFILFLLSTLLRM